MWKSVHLASRAVNGLSNYSWFFASFKHFINEHLSNLLDFLCCVRWHLTCNLFCRLSFDLEPFGMLNIDFSHVKNYLWLPPPLTSQLMPLWLFVSHILATFFRRCRRRWRRHPTIQNGSKTMQIAHGIVECVTMTAITYTTTLNAPLHSRQIHFKYLHWNNA